jgi:hypothetical protein
MAAVARDLRWKIALRLPVDHRRWNPNPWNRYRARLLLHGRERLALANSPGLAEEPGLLDTPAEQVVASAAPAGRRRRGGAGHCGGADAFGCLAAPGRLPPAAQPPLSEGVPQVGQPMVDFLQEPLDRRVSARG